MKDKGRGHRKTNKKEQKHSLRRKAGSGRSDEVEKSQKIYRFSASPHRQVPYGKTGSDKRKVGQTRRDVRER